MQHIAGPAEPAGGQDERRFQSLYQPSVGGSDGYIQKRQMEVDIQLGKDVLFKGTPAGLYAGGHQGRDDTGFP